MGRKGDRSFLPHQGGCRVGPAGERNEDKVVEANEDDWETRVGQQGLLPWENKSVGGQIWGKCVR